MAKTALVTGASSGIGRMVAQALKSAGFKVYAAARRVDRMADLEKEAAARYHSTSLQAARCALDAGVGKLIAGHYSSRYRDTAPLLAELRSVFPNSFAADDGDVFDVPLDSRR